MLKSVRVGEAHLFHGQPVEVIKIKRAITGWSPQVVFFRRPTGEVHAVEGDKYRRFSEAA